MSKVQLGKRPESFAPVLVKFQMPDGTEGFINAVFKYRTRTEYGAFQDSVYAPAVAPAPVSTAAPSAETQSPEGEATEALPSVRLTLNDVQAGVRDKLASHLHEALLGWDLDQPFGLESLKSLADELPSACQALIDAYGMACTQGRLGN